MTQEKVCFRYDGSPEAIEALNWVNEKNETSFVGIKNKYYTNDGNCYNNILRTYTLVPPAEFLRLVKRETQWTPKYGEEVEVSDNLINWHKHIYIGKNPIQNVLPYIIVTDDGYLIQYKHIRPVRKSLREEINQLVRNWLLSKTTVGVTSLANSIFDLVKERRNEL